MRLKIEIEDNLIKDARKATGTTSIKEVIELGLKTLIQPIGQSRIKSFRGQLEWSGDLDDMRSNY